MVALALFIRLGVLQINSTNRRPSRSRITACGQRAVQHATPADFAGKFFGTIGSSDTGDGQMVIHDAPVGLGGRTHAAAAAADAAAADAAAAADVPRCSIVFRRTAPAQWNGAHRRQLLGVFVY